jgi:uncharacterized protein YdaU (DUF1376 family)
MGKGADTWMPLYVGDYLRDTGDLTSSEHGGYLLLLMQAWVRGGLLPTDDTRLRMITKMDTKEWKRSGPILLAFFHRDGDGFRHKRLDRELANATSMTEQRKAAGKASAEARARARNGYGQSSETINGNPTSVGTATPTGGSTNGQQTSRPSPSPSQSKLQFLSGLKLPAAPFADFKFIRVDPGTGRPSVQGWNLDRSQERVFEAAGIDDTRWTGDIQPLIAWLAAGIDLDVIVTTIRRCAERPGYNVPSRLSYFDKPVRESHGKVPA